MTRFDPRAKLGVLLVFLIAVSTTPFAAQLRFAGYATMLLAAIVLTRSPLKRILRRSAGVLPFTAFFAFMTWLAGDAQRAVGLLEKSSLSIVAAVTITNGTSMDEIARALSWARVPRTLVLVIEFVHRYLFVAAEEVRRFQRAARSRSGRRGARRAQFAAAAGALGVLFAKSWQRADAIYQAMLARGFRGNFPQLHPLQFRSQDLAFVAGAIALLLALRSLA